MKSVQSEFGGRYRPFTNYLTELGINHRLTCPHTSHQNGTVERKHRYIVEMGLMLLAHAFVPITFWDHSFATSLYLINRLSSPNSPKFNSPFQALYGKEPDYKPLKVFGCAYFALLRPYNKHKLQLRSQECVYHGISPQHKGFKCLSKEGKIYISKDVRFHEQDFPFSNMFPSKFVSSCTKSPRLH